MFRWLMLGLGLRSLLRLFFGHLAIVNEGSPTAEQAHEIADPELAQALYGRVAANADHYRFQAPPATLIRFSMLVPETGYAAGQRMTIQINGPGLPASGWLLPSRDAGTRQGTTSYRRTQRDEFTATGGEYRVRISSNQPGAYCFCIGTREPDYYADEATRRRAREIVGEE